MKIALVDGSTVLQTWHTDSGEVVTRYTLPDGSQVSPVIVGWSNGKCAVVEVTPFTAPKGQRIVGSPSYKVTDGKAVETYAVEDSPPERRMIRKSVVQTRLIQAGLMDAAYAALTSNSAYFARWFAPDRPEIYADDPDALLLLSAIGADAMTIMAGDD